MSDRTIEEWVARAEATLAAAGHKRGGARRAVVELLDARECALTAVEIEDALRAQGRAGEPRERLPDPRRAGAVRLVQRVETGQAMVRYERVCASTRSTTTISCATVRRGDAVLRPGAGARDRDAQRAGAPGEVSEHEIVLHGSCLECAA